MVRGTMATNRRFALLLTSGTGSGPQQQLEVLPASATAVDAGLQEVRQPVLVLDWVTLHATYFTEASSWSPLWEGLVHSKRIHCIKPKRRPLGVTFSPMCLFPWSPQGAYYRSKVAPRAQLYWKQSPLNWHANPLASALCGSHVCGDAVLELEGVFECEWELSARLSAILTKASPRSQLLQGVAVQGQGWAGELPVNSALGGGDSSSSSDGQFPGPRSPPGPRSMLTVPQLPNSSPTAMNISSSTGSRSASAPVPIPSPLQQQQEQQQQQQPAFQGLGSAAAVGAAAGGSPGEEFEPRQALMWAIASRATSISWAPSTPPARQGGTAAAAATAAASASSSILVQGVLAASAVASGGLIEAGNGRTCQAMEEEPCIAMAASTGSASSAGNGSSCSEEQAGTALGVAAGSVVDELQSPRWASRWADTRSEILATVVQQAGRWVQARTWLASSWLVGQVGQWLEGYGAAICCVWVR